jgi:signal transduction histidine kinase/GAF domain-containing protein
MLSFDLKERVHIARFMTDAGFSSRNESAANIERFEHRIIDDEWDLVFNDARKSIASVPKIVNLVNQHVPKTPIFGVIKADQANQEDLMALGIIDLFNSDNMQRMPNSVIRELGAKADRELAVEARRLQNEIKIAVDERTVLAEIDRLVSSSLDIGLIYEQLIEQVKRLIPVEAAAIIVAYVASDSVTFEHITGTLMPGFEQRLVIPMSSFTDANQLARFVLVLDTELLEDMRSEYPGIESLLETGVRSAMSTPLIHHDEVVGLLATTSTEENAYTPEHVETAERIGAQISGALANSRLHAEMSRIARQREILVQIGRDANVALDEAGLYESVFKNICELIPVDRGVIALANDENESLFLSYVSGVDVEVIRAGDSLNISDLSTLSIESSGVTEIEREKLQQGNLLSNMCSPLRVRDAVIGFISISSREGGSYNKSHLALLDQIAGQISPVIESLKLLEKVRSLAATAETTLDLVAMCDLEGISSYINPAGLRMLNLDEQSSGIGIDLTGFISEEISDVIRNSGLHQADVMGGWQAEISLTPDESVDSFPVDMQLVPVRNAENVMVSVNVFMRDLREREAGQIERREFVSTVSHELRTPLTSMKMYTDMLGEGDAGELNDQQQRLVNNLKSTVDRLSRMVDDLNVVSMLEAGRFSLLIDRCDVDDMVVSAVEITEPNFADRGITVNTVHLAKPAFVDADRERILQVMINLLTNAAKYADKETETTVTVSIDEHEVRVEVADKGPGIEQNELEAVFESFYRSKTARISRVSGSGLGLSIAKGFVEAQGGRIWAESTVGEGSRFMFTLPLVLN